MGALGAPKTGGRVRGTPNKKTDELMALLADGPNPITVLKDLLTHEDANFRLTAARELAQYLYPKRKSIEHTSATESSIIGRIDSIRQMSKEDQVKMLEGWLEKLKNG